MSEYLQLGPLFHMHAPLVLIILSLNYMQNFLLSRFSHLAHF